MSKDILIFQLYNMDEGTKQMHDIYLFVRLFLVLFFDKHTHSLPKFSYLSGANTLFSLAILNRLPNLQVSVHI
jgi:hypothetical protein